MIRETPGSSQGGVVHFQPTWTTVTVPVAAAAADAALAAPLAALAALAALEPPDALEAAAELCSNLRDKAWPSLTSHSAPASEDGGGAVNGGGKW